VDVHELLLPRRLNRDFEARLKPDEQRSRAKSKCHECHELWGEYISACFQQIQLEREIYFVTTGEEGGSVAALEPALNRAKVVADSIGERIRKHGSAHVRTEPRSQAESN